MVKESLQNAIIAFGNDTTVCTSIILAPGNFVSYLWQNGSTASTFTVYKSGHYSVSVVDNEGCASSAGVNVVVDCNDIYFPTAFTPNNDGLNDFFGAIGNISSIQLYELKVFNRWGEMVFYSTNPQIKWSGKIKDLLAPVGTYTWISQYTLVGREPNSKHGSITLIR
jgi:gliding motility-associated-like protein